MREQHLRSWVISLKFSRITQANDGRAEEGGVSDVITRNYYLKRISWCKDYVKLSSVSRLLSYWNPPWNQKRLQEIRQRLLQCIGRGRSQWLKVRGKEKRTKVGWKGRRRGEGVGRVHIIMSFYYQQYLLIRKALGSLLRRVIFGKWWKGKCGLMNERWMPFTLFDTNDKGIQMR